MDTGGCAQQQREVTTEIPDRRRPGQVGCLGRYRALVSGIHVRNGCIYFIGSAERKGCIPTNALGEGGHDVPLLGTLSHEGSHVGAAPRDGTRRIAVGNLRSVSDTDESANRRIGSSGYGGCRIAVTDIAVLDETAEAAAIVALGSDTAAGNITVGRSLVLNARETAGIDSTGDTGVLYIALAGGDIAATGGAVTQLADKAADSAGAGGRNRRVGDIAAIERDAAQAAAYKTADPGIGVRRVCRNSTAGITAVNECGILRNAGKTGRETLSGNVTSSNAVVEGGGAAGPTGETAHRAGLDCHRSRRRAGSIGIRNGGIADETARITAIRRNGRGIVHLAADEVGAGIACIAHETANVIDGGLRGRDGRALHFAIDEGVRLIAFSDETAGIKFIARRSLVLVQGNAFHLTGSEDGGNLILVDTRDVRNRRKAAQMVGTTDHGIDHFAAGNGALSTHMAGKAARSRGAGHRGFGNGHIGASSHAGIIGLRRTQETGYHAGLGGGVDGGAAERHIGNGTVQHAGETGVGDSAAGQAADRVPAAVQVDALVERRGAVQRRPVANAGGVDVIEQLEMLDRLADQDAGIVHVVQLTSVRDQIRILHGAVAGYEILQVELHARDGIHFAALEGLVSGNADFCGINLIVRCGNIDRELGSVRQVDVFPGQHHIGREHLVIPGNIDILERQGIIHAVDAESGFLQGRNAFRQLGLQFYGRALPEGAAMLFRPRGRESDVGVVVDTGQERLVAQMVRGTVAVLGGDFDIDVRRIE